MRVKFLLMFGYSSVYTKYAKYLKLSEIIIFIVLREWTIVSQIGTDMSSRKTFIDVILGDICQNSSVSFLFSRSSRTIFQDYVVFVSCTQSRSTTSKNGHFNERLKLYRPINRNCKFSFLKNNNFKLVRVQLLFVPNIKRI